MPILNNSQLAKTIGILRFTNFLIESRKLRPPPPSRHCHMNATLVAPEARGSGLLGALGSGLGAQGSGLGAQGLWPEACGPGFRTRGTGLAS